MLSATEGPCGKGFAGGIVNAPSTFPKCPRAGHGAAEGAREPRRETAQGAGPGQPHARSSAQVPAAPPCTGTFRVSVPTSTNRILKIPTNFPFPPSLSPGKQMQLCSPQSHPYPGFSQILDLYPKKHAVFAVPSTSRGHSWCLVHLKWENCEHRPLSHAASISLWGRWSRCPGQSVWLLTLGKEKPP